jgi:hypothetical protein
MFAFPAGRRRGRVTGIAGLPYLVARRGPNTSIMGTTGIGQVIRMKIALIALFLAFAGGAVRGQTYHPILKAGLNISDLGKQDFGFVSRLTYHGGVGLEMKYTPFFSLQPELVYSLQGAAKDINREFRLNYHYLNLPVIARMYVYHDASFHLGLQYGFLLKAVDRDNINNDDITDSVNRHDLAGVIGFGYTLSEKLVFDLRYNIGFTNTAGFDVIFQQRVTNRVMQLSVGYLF